MSKDVDWHKLRADMAQAIKKATGKGISRTRMDAIIECVMWQAIDYDAWIDARGLDDGLRGIDAFLKHIEGLAYESRH